MNPEIEILFQDEYYIAVNKPSGMLVHYYKECTDTTNLMRFVRDQTGFYLYPLHRLDRPVSGIVLFAIDQTAASELKKIWNTDQVEKKYTALVKGEITAPGVFDFDLSNENKIKQTAITHYEPLESFGAWNTLVEVKIETGRKHQIRRHFSRRCYQIIGDTAHGKGKVNRYFREHYDLNRIFLHGHSFKFIHPITHEKIHLKCPLPEELEHVLLKLRTRLNEPPREMRQGLEESLAPSRPDKGNEKHY